MIKGLKSGGFMEQKSKDWFLSYGILLGKRFTEKQKLKFITRAKKELENMGYQTEVSQTTLSGRGFGKKTYYNLYAGDTIHSDILIYTYYDTPMKRFFSNTLFAFQSNYDKKNMIFSFLLGMMIIFISVFVFVNFIHANIVKNGIFSIWGLAFVLLLLAAFGCINGLKYGIANTNNIVRNSSSIIAMLSLIDQLEEAKKQRICFAFIDEGTSSEIGIKILEKYLPKNKKIKIYLDCVGAKGEINVLSDIKYPSPHRRDMIKKYSRYGSILLTRGVFMGEEIQIEPVKYDSFEAFEQQNNEIVGELNKILKQILKT